MTSWLHLLIWLLVSGFLCRSRSLQLVEARIESIVPHMVEVDSAQHGDGPHKWDLHAEHWFQAHGLAHVESIAHHGQHGERSRAQDPSNRGVGFGQCSSLIAIRHGNITAGSLFLEIVRDTHSNYYVNKSRFIVWHYGKPFVSGPFCSLCNKALHAVTVTGLIYNLS